MYTLGVTGGIGSGKTTVCRILEDLGARVLDADREAKRLMEARDDVRAELVAAFGPATYAADGRLDRAYLAGRVFGDAEAVARINAIVHPRVREALAEAQAQARRDGVGLLVYEAALIFESGSRALLDGVLVVDAPSERRVARVVARDASTEAQVRARMGHQLPPEELRARADFVIENDGTLDDLRARVEALYRRLTRPG